MVDSKKDFERTTRDCILTEKEQDTLFLQERVLSHLIDAYRNATSEHIKVSLTAAIKCTVKEIYDSLNSRDDS